MLHHAGVVFGEQGDVERPAAAADMVEADLIAEGGLAAAGWPLNDVEAALEEATVQDDVKACNAAWKPVQNGITVTRSWAGCFRVPRHGYGEYRPAALRIVYRNHTLHCLDELADDP